MRWFYILWAIDRNPIRGCWILGINSRPRDSFGLDRNCFEQSGYSNDSKGVQKSGLINSGLVGLTGIVAGFCEILHVCGVRK